MEALIRQRGVALPVALVMLAVMLFSAIYLMRASSNATIVASSLAYERDISRRADFGLSTAYDWLSTVSSSAATKSNLDADQPANGYNAAYSCAASNCYRDSAFWNNALTVNDPAGNPVQYVIHRMCQFPVAYNAKFGAADNVCVQTVAVAAVSTGGVGAGASLSSDSDTFINMPQIHYVITSRVEGVKGSSVINQMVVLIGA